MDQPLLSLRCCRSAAALYFIHLQVPITGSPLPLVHPTLRMTWWPWLSADQSSALPPSPPQPASPTAASAEESTFSVDDESPFELSIIDESGEGWGFELDPETIARPLAMTSLGLFSVGALAGIPAGLALGRTADDSGGKNKPRPTLGGALFAVRAFAAGTALCGAVGAAAAYATAWHYDAWTWTDFGAVMRDVVPRRMDTIEGAVGPLLGSVRKGATDGLPGPTARAKDRFAESRIGKYIRAQIEEATRDLANEGDDESIQTS